MTRALKIFLSGLVLFLPLLVLHGNELADKDLAEQISSLTVTLITVTAIIVALLVLISLTKKQLTKPYKLALFWGLAVPVILVSLFVAGSTIYLNIISETKGPVHWHADFRIFNCGQEVNLSDPTGLSNRIGPADFHEHGDDRIHVEGTVNRLSDVSLANFFRVLGGQLTSDELTVPTNQGLLSWHNGERCQTGKPRWRGRRAAWQTFLYQTKGDTVIQEKLADPVNYVLSPYAVVPPGDCLIFEFTPEIKNQTDKICDFYAIELEKGNYKAINFKF